MLDFNTFNARLGITLILSAFVTANCNYDPPSIDTGSGGGGAGGSDTSNSSSTSSSSTSSSSTTSSSSGGSDENCVNDVDDNSDKQVDCADPTCSPTYECVPSGPTDNKWSTPFHAKLISFDDAEPACATNAAPKLYAVGPSPDGCTACKCEISGAMCTGAQLTCYDTTDCADGVAPKLVINAVTCTNIINSAYKTCNVTKEPTFDMGNAQCKVLSGGMRVDPSSFAKKLVRCDAPRNTGEGCGMGQSCALAPTAEYDWQCIAAAGSQTCPANWSIPLTGYDTWSDSRVCPPCSCDLGSGSCASNNIFTKHTDAACQAAPSGGIGPSSCNFMQGTTSIGYHDQAPFMPPKGCGSVQAGQLAKSGETTICCRPASP